MSWELFLMVIFITTANSMNQPVYKIILTQKGFAQFLQYDIETPPIREFTFCTWIRVFDLSNDQSVFTYVVNGNNRVLRLWLETGGRHIYVSINEKKSSSVPVDISKDTWRHICFSFQSDFGAWALYLDGRLAFCEASLTLYGYVLPASGSVIIGYGTVANGVPKGFEGEIFGANMILTSTIERNYTMKRDPQYKQKPFRKNKVLANNNIKYTILDHETMDTSTVMSLPKKLHYLNRNSSFVKMKIPNAFIDSELGFPVSNKKTKSIDMSSESEIFDFPTNDKKYSDYDNEHITFWNLFDSAKGKARKKVKSTELSSSGTYELPVISEFETPPPPVPVQIHYKVRQPAVKSFYDINNNDTKTHKKSSYSDKKYEISELQSPPPPDKKSKVYGQWTSSKFANSVLNYIKNINLKNREKKKIPTTIPLIKLTDSFPYSSDFKVAKIRPSYKFQRKFIDTHNYISKRDINYPQINVKILRHDLRRDIIEEHAKTKPNYIEVTSRGEPRRGEGYRFYRNVDKQIFNKDVFGSKVVPQPFSRASINNLNKNSPSFDSYKSTNLITILPFLKSAEYFVDDYDSNKSISNDMYTKSLSNANKWHNVKSYNSDYTPRKIDMESGKFHDNIDIRVAEANKKHPSLRLKYTPDNHKVIKSVDDDVIIKGRALALEISNASETKSDSVSLLKYNHGYLPYQQISMQSNNQKDVNNLNSQVDFKKDNFDQHVKLGNALNERHIIGNNKRQHKKSFIGGDEKIPDIHRYRSDIDNENGSVPPSLGPKVCKNVELFDRLFYIQPDGSIDITNILSPVKEKNIAIEFIVQNYKRCSTENSDFQRNPLLFIDWSKTPVRLFGGAHPRRTKDLCGFF